MVFANNVNLEMYTRAMENLAGEHDVPFVDLFTPSLAIMKERSQPLTFNGIHLRDDGHSVIAEILDAGLFGDHPNRGQAPPELRAEVNEKNFFFFHRYRAVNGYYIYGGRSQRDNGKPSLHRLPTCSRMSAASWTTWWPFVTGASGKSPGGSP